MAHLGNLHLNLCPDVEDIPLSTHLAFQVKKIQELIDPGDSVRVEVKAS
jgi:hypothetical protein